MYHILLDRCTDNKEDTRNSNDYNGNSHSATTVAEKPPIYVEILEQQAEDGENLQPVKLRVPSGRSVRRNPPLPPPESSTSDLENGKQTVGEYNVCF